MTTIGFLAGLPVWAIWGLTAALSLVLLRIAVIDARHLRIPDALSLPLGVVGLALAFGLPGGAGGAHLTGAVAGFVIFAAIGEGYFRLRGVDGLGWGDAKLFAAAGAWVGWRNLALVLLIAALGGLAQALWARRGAQGRDVPMAFGPWIAGGFWLVWIWAVIAGR